MADAIVLIFHRPASTDDAPLIWLLADVRLQLAQAQSELFRRAGATEVQIRVGLPSSPSFGELLVEARPSRGGVVVMGSGAVPRLRSTDAGRLLDVAASGERVALTNNRYSSDVCAIGDATVLADVPPLPSDNALPRWLEEHAGVAVEQLAGRERLALDIDSPLDIALWTLATDAPRWIRDVSAREGISVPRGNELRSLATDPWRELLVFGRAGSPTLRWLERNVRCRVRFLAEERGLRASSPLAIGGARAGESAPRAPRATLGRLLDQRGPEALGSVVGELADGAIIDTRVLMADRFGADEESWPAPADRYASDLLRADEVSDPWLRALTESAAAAPVPIVLGAHTLVGPGIPLLLHGARD
jgi:hypothetical protein